MFKLALGRVTALAAVLGLLWVAPSHAQQTAKVLATCGTASYTAGTTNYQTLDTTGASCGAAASGTGTVQGNQSNAAGGTTGATNVPTVSYTYGWNGSAWIQTLVDTGGHLSISGSGPLSNGTAQSGSLLGAGIYNSSPPTATTGQELPLQTNNSGGLYVAAQGTLSQTGASPTPGALKDPTGVIRPLAEAPYIYNGATTDLAFTCPNTAAVSVTAGNTTQIVALSGTTVIRVCSLSLGISLAGTVNVVTGTGTNCGTPTTISNPIPMATSQMWQQTAPFGGSLFSSTAGGEICIAAATGNVTGFITYAQF